MKHDFNMTNFTEGPILNSTQAHSHLILEGPKMAAIHFGSFAWVRNSPLGHTVIIHSLHLFSTFHPERKHEHAQHAISISNQPSSKYSNFSGMEIRQLFCVTLKFWSPILQPWRAQAQDFLGAGALTFYNRLSLTEMWHRHTKS